MAKHLRIISDLSKQEYQNLLEIERSKHPSRFKRRAMAIRLSSEGFSRNEIQGILKVTKDTLTAWFHSWVEKGICFIYDQARSGRPLLITQEKQDLVIGLVEQHPRQLKQALTVIQQELGISMHETTLKRFLKKPTTVGNAFVKA
jgi:transposase